jgi:hypothetical protein
MKGRIFWVTVSSVLIGTFCCLKLAAQAGPFQSPGGRAKQSVRTAHLVKAYGNLPLRFE